MTSICVFCGTSPGKDDEYLTAARALGQLLARRGITLVYGGSSVGLMGAVANACLRAGGRAVGVMPRDRWDAEVGHRGLSDLFLVDSQDERKRLMGEMSDAFLVLPGGLPTLDEFLDVWNGRLLEMHAKPIGVLDVKGYWTGLFGFIDRMLTECFLKPEHRQMVRSAGDVETLVDFLVAGRETTRPFAVEQDALCATPMPA